MKHYELLKLVPGADPVEVQEKLSKCFRKLNDATDWVTHPIIYRSCREEDDYDLMIVVDIDGEERVAELMTHPLASELEGKVKDFIHKHKTFDHY